MDVPASTMAPLSAAGLYGKEALVVDLGHDHVRNLLQIAAPADPVATGGGRDAESHRLSELTLLVDGRLTDGWGAVILRGPPPEEYDSGGFALAFQRLAQRLGQLAPQDATGARVVAVAATDGPTTARGYQRDIALRPHTDFHEFMGLACVRSASSGGETLLASADRVYSILAVERPDLVASLLEGFPQSFAGEEFVTPEPAPVFAIDQAGVAIFAHRLFYRAAARNLGIPLPATLQEGMEMIASIASRPEVGLSFRLEPGEILFWNNFRLLHGRTGFDRDHDRLLLRVWINPANARWPHSSFESRTRQLDTMHSNGLSPIAYK